MAKEPRGGFAAALRNLRTRARLTQEALADAAGLSLRALSDLERGVAAVPQKETVRLLGDALGLTGSEREEFETRPGAGPPRTGRRTSRRRCGRCRGTWTLLPGGSGSSSSWPGPR